MSFTVEKIGGTSMTAFDAVLDNILLRPKNKYNRLFVVSAYSGITDALLECKKTGKPGIYGLIKASDASWQDALVELEQRMVMINRNIFADPSYRMQADEFIKARLSDAKACIENILDTCQYSQFAIEDYLPQIREFLASLGETHSAFNTALKLEIHGVNSVFVDLSGWTTPREGKLDDVINEMFAQLDISKTLPIVTGYCHCEEGLMQTYDRGYSEMTFSRIAALGQATEAIIHKEYHLSSADPRIVGAEEVLPIGHTNFDVADQLANLGMEAIHPNAAAGLREQGIALVVKNTFEPEHPGTVIDDSPQNNDQLVDIIAGKNKVYALHVFDQSMVGNIEATLQEIINYINKADVKLLGKEMNANSLTYFLTGSPQSLDALTAHVEQRCPDAKVSGKMVALISAIGAKLDSDKVLSQGMAALIENSISPISVHATIRNVDVQFCIEDSHYHAALRALHGALIDVDLAPSLTSHAA